MSTVKVAAGELSGAALDWAVAKAVGDDVTVMPGMAWKSYRVWTAGSFVSYSPSTDGARAMPLLHKHAVALEPADAWQEFGNDWMATCIATRADADHSFYHQHGETPLIAGMRAIVGAILGDTIEVPSELLEQSA